MDWPGGRRVAPSDAPSGDDAAPAGAADENILHTVCAARDGSVWVGTDEAGAFRYRDGVFSHFGAEQGLTNGHVCAILEDRPTNLWFSTPAGVSRRADERIERGAGPSALNGRVLVLLEDRADSLWFGTPRGWVCPRGGAFTVHRLAEPPSAFDVRAMAEDAAGNLWVGTIGDGLFYRRGARFERCGSAQGFPHLHPHARLTALRTGCRGSGPPAAVWRGSKKDASPPSRLRTAWRMLC